MALVDALGNLVRFVRLPGRRHDSIGVGPLITGLDFEALIDDKTFETTGRAYYGCPLIRRGPPLRVGRRTYELGLGLASFRLRM
jgi:hypothetical protein